MRLKALMFSIALTLVFSGIIFANGGKEEMNTAGGAAEVDMVEIEVFQSKTTIADQFEALAREFEAANPDIKVSVDTVGGSADWKTILKSRFTAEEGPTLFNIEGPAQYELWKENIADLTGESFLDGAVDAAKAPLNIGGRQWGMPVNFEGYGYIYNKDIFAEAGITDMPTNFSGLRAAAMKLENAGYTAWATGYGTWWVLGLHLLNATFAQLDDPQVFMEGLTAGTMTMAGTKEFQDLKNLIDLTVEYGEANPLATDHNQQVQLLANGDVAMIQQGVWKETALYAASPDLNIGLLPIAMNDDTKMNRVPLGVPWYFVVNSQATAAEQDAAKKFLDFMFASDTGKRYLVEEFGYIPAVKGVPSTGLGGVGKDILAFAADDRTIPWLFGQWPDGFAQQDAFNNLQAYIGGQQSWQDTLEALDEAWQDRAN